MRPPIGQHSLFNLRISPDTYLPNCVLLSHAPMLRIESNNTISDLGKIGQTPPKRNNNLRVSVRPTGVLALGTDDTL